MFLNQERSKIVTIDNFQLKFNYPTIANEIEIESKKNIFTRGQYSTLSMSWLQSQQDILSYTDALCTISVCVKFVDVEKGYYWEGFCDEEGKLFIKKVYDEFLKWRESFRNRNDGDIKET